MRRFADSAESQPTPRNTRVTPLSAVLTALVLIAALHASAAVEDLAITEVDTINGAIEVTNLSTEAFTNTDPLPFAIDDVYTNTIPASTTFDPGESMTFNIALTEAGSDVWLYQSIPGGVSENDHFSNPDNIVSGLQYGTGSTVDRTSEAVSAGIWTATGDLVPAANPGETLQLVSHPPKIDGESRLASGPSFWQSRPATTDAYFGTGTEIADPIPEPMPVGTVQVALAELAGGLTSPITLIDPDDGTGRLFITDQNGFVLIFRGGVIESTPFMDVTSYLVDVGIEAIGGFDERGFLGLALHPDFATNGLLYTYTSEPRVPGAEDFTLVLTEGEAFDHQSVISEWNVDSGNPDLVDTSSRRVLLRWDEPQFNHNGGTIRFGSDGMLYIAVGDGGGADDQTGHPFSIPPATVVDGHGENGNGQDNTNIYGTLLRIDVEGSDSANGQYGIPADNPFVGDGSIPGEIYAWGMRNPFFFSFDRTTSDLYAADVGQNDIEEVNIVQPGGNYGWRLKEGSFFFDPKGVLGDAETNGVVVSIPVEPLPDDLQEPFTEYDHDEGVSIIGGFVYRGSAIPALQGLYVCGDFGRGGPLFYSDSATGEIFRLADGGGEALFTGTNIKGFGEDADGELYVLSSGSTPEGSDGRLFKITPPGITSVTDWLNFE